MPDGRLVPLTRHRPSEEAENGQQGAVKTIRFIARQWASAPVEESISVQGHLNSCRAGGSSPILQPMPDPARPVDLDLFLGRLKTRMFSISCMAFQDAWNLDLERVRDCCIHVLSPEGGLIPFCMYNLTDIRGKGIYRKKQDGDNTSA